MNIKTKITLRSTLPDISIDTSLQILLTYNYKVHSIHKQRSNAVNNKYMLVIILFRSILIISNY